MNEIAPIPAASLTRFSESTSSAVARWGSDIDSAVFYAPIVPGNAEPALRLAAREHEAALAPATRAQATTVLMAMRGSTQRRNETIEETRHSFTVLVREVADVPLDILEEACRLYVRQQVHFPRSPTELLAYINPLIGRRRRRAINLARLADLAAQQAMRDLELANEGKASLADLRELVRNPSVKPTILDTYLTRQWADQADVETVKAEIAERQAAVSPD